MNKQRLLVGTVGASLFVLGTVIAGTIPLATTQLTGGTTNVAKLDPDAIPTSGPDAAGKVCSNLPGGAPMDDLTISFDNGSATGVSIGGKTASASGSNAFHLTFEEDVNHEACVDLEITGLSGDGSGKDVEINATPSIESSVDGVVIEVNPFPRFAFESNLDLMRTSITDMDHGGGLAFVYNDDSEQSISALEGTVSFPEGANRTLLMVEVQSERGEKLPATVTVSGNGFSVERISPIAAGEGRRIVMWFDNGAGEVNARLQLTARYGR